MSLVLHGYHYSVYLRIARLTLAEKGYHAHALPMGEFIKAAGA